MKFINRFAFPFLICVLAFSMQSCFLRKKRTQAESNSSTAELKSVTLTVLKTIPYCKGMPPTEEELNATEPEPERTFFLTKQDDTSFSLAFTTNQNGQVVLNLAPGLYCVKSIDKKQNFDSFYTKNLGANTDFIQYGDKECFWNWWVSCDGEFKVSEGKSEQQHQILRVYRCHTADHPCKYYNGPMPPSSR